MRCVTAAKFQINPKLSPNHFPLASFCARKNTIIGQKEGFLVKVKRERLVIENRLEIELQDHYCTSIVHKPQHSSFVQTIKICMSFPSYPSVGEPYEKHFPMYLSTLLFLLCQSQALCLKGTVDIFPRFYFYSSGALQINENRAPAPAAVRPLLRFFC